MSLAVPLAIRAVGMVCSVGYTAVECQASVRAGIARIAAGSVLSRAGTALPMALVPQEGLRPLPRVDTALRNTRHRRMLRLAATAITEASEAYGAPLPVTLVTAARDGDGSPLLDDLLALLDGRLLGAGSGLRAQGSAGVGLALADAAHRVASGAEHAVMIVGVDSLLDFVRLDALQRSQRVLVDDATDGFLPGEGAAAVVVSAAGDDDLPTLADASVTTDPFTREGDAALTGDGLSTALREVMTGADQQARTVWASINGEAWTAREWAIAARRNHHSLADGMQLRHPVECFGDPGAALGAMLLVLAAGAWGRRDTLGPSLVCTASEEGLRGALRLEPPRRRS